MKGQLRRRQFSQTLAAAALPTLPMLATASAPAWAHQATIYQVNVRQYSREGTLKAVERDLPRLKALGVEILWVMPWQPIGKKRRKGGLGSYYSIRDYTAVNPEFGTLADAKSFVSAAHAQGFKVILDWVANHTAWDHPWAAAHKDWYKLNAEGEIYPVTFGAGTDHEERWDDVIALNYANPELRAAMVQAMKFWLREVGLDGFRCDVASLVPTDFWVAARRELEEGKPLFMLAESDAIELHTSGAFDMTYSWDLADVFKAIGKGEPGVPRLKAWVAKQPAGYPPGALRMRFTSNHDFNSWHGTDGELYGPAYPALAALTFLLPGMPLIYNGEESGLAKRLAFFEKDPIAWGRYELSGFYAELVALKRRHAALAPDADLRVLEAPPEVFAFERRAGHDVLRVAVNLSGRAQGFDGKALKPWGWLAG